MLNHIQIPLKRIFVKVKAYCGREKVPNSTYTYSRIEICEYNSDLAVILTKWSNLSPGLESRITLDRKTIAVHGTVVK
ncbi:hypothetical protein N7526_005596 [Penicillium atrosanguineum]|nr:hypothetical protein N7526_005596 [Penicillium atrosanguineum]